MSTPRPQHPCGLMIAAPTSGSGKTTITLGLIRALITQGHKVSSAKAGPDYIDPKFHHAASASACINLDPWAMRPETLKALAQSTAAGSDLFIVEAMMGLFDGARDGSGSSADLAEYLGLSVVLVVDASSQSHSIAALVQGFANYRENCTIVGIILNRVGSAAHEKMLRQALAPSNIPVIGALAREDSLNLPDRHLGLVQAGEHHDLEDFIQNAAGKMIASLDLSLLASLAKPLDFAQPASQITPLPPLGQRIAIARDIAFEFTYPHFLQSWRGAGAEISFFSPLANEAPTADSDAIFLPGGYPELHAGKLAGNETFLQGLRTAAQSHALIYGECGGYMVLGEALRDTDGTDHAMAGLLPVHTSFATRKLHLGYRKLVPCAANTPWSQTLSAHEFHYASILEQQNADPLFDVVDATDAPLGTMGHKRGTVMGSFAHIIDYGP